MAFTANSTIAEILKKPGAKAIFDKHVGVSVDLGQLRMVMDMSLQQVADFVEWDKEKLEGLVKDLNAA
ncbi:MAG: hypothetical protein NTX46_05975 [Chloroflexi bacterium]|nr:hypothetical protein [Chloroflexota bacterium]